MIGSNTKPGSKPVSSKLAQKQNKKFKKINDKYYDKVVDYFPRDAEGDSMGFNQAPVIKSYTPGEKNKSKRSRSAGTGLSGTLRGRNLYQEYVSDEEDEDLELSKKIKPDAELEDYEDGLLSGSKGMAEYFLDNKNALKTLTKIGNFNYDEGSVVLAAVCDKGPNDKYLVVSLPRNKKGYVYCSEAGRDGAKTVKSFQIGEYVLGMTLNSDPRKVQFSLKPETINKELRIAQVNNNQVLCGYLRDKEDYGYTVDFCTEDGALGFLQFPEMDGLKLVLGKPYLFSISGKNESTNVFNCQIIHSSLMFNTQALNYNDLAGEDEEEVADLQRLTDPGNLVQAHVKKVMENGLLVNFLNLFYGFIFQDHLAKPLSSYKLNQKVTARIIATNAEVKQIHLSDLDFHVGLNVYKTDVAPGTKFQKAYVKEELYGGSYILEVGGKPAKKGKKAEAPQEGPASIKAFLHGTHLVQEEGEEEGLKAGAILKKEVFVMSFNHFEHYLIVSMRDDILSKIQSSFVNLKVGDITTGVVAKVIEGGPQGAKIIVNLTGSVSGAVSAYHVSDLASKKTLKTIKEGKKVKVRVLSVDAAGKKLALTMKPSLLDSTIEILSDYQDAQTGVAYYGVIIGSSEKGYVFKFFNDIQGFLPFQDIENNGSKKEDYALGQVVKVFVKFVDINTKKMGLTLSSDAKKNLKNKDARWESVKDQNENIKSVSESGISEGDVYEYKILQKKSAVNESFLYAKSTKGVILEKGNYVAHVAVLPKSHCSDFEVHNERLFEFYKISDAKIQAKVLGFLPNNNILITQKPSLIRQGLPKAMEDLTEKHSYFGYVDSCIQSGARVKLSEHVKGILAATKLPEAIQEDFSSHLPSDKTLQVLVTKIKGDEKKLYFELAPPQKESMSLEDEKSFFVDYLNEEFILANQEVTSNLALWSTYKIGNYIKGTIQMVKDYGIIINLNGKLAGLILKSNLLKSVEQYKVGQQVICRILDVDYEKSIVDLSEESIDAKKFESKLSKKLNYNREKIVKHKLHKNKSEVLSATVLLVKELYLVAKLVKHPKVLVLIQCKRFNDFSLSHEVFQKDSIVRFKSLNGDVFNSAAAKDAEALRKSSNTLIGEVFASSKKDEKLSDDPAKSDAQLKKRMKVGLKLSGVVTKITQSNLFVALTKSMFGRIHKTQFDTDAETGKSTFENYKVGDEVQCRVISIRKGDHIYIDLTARQDLVELPEGGKMDLSEVIVDTVDESHKGKKYQAIVKSVSAKSANPLYFELSNTIFAHVGLFEGLLDPQNTQVTDQFDKITHIEDHYKPGDMVEVWIKGVHKKTANRNDKGSQYSIEVSLFDPNENKTQSQSEVALGTKSKTEYKIGDLVICRIVKVLPRGVKVRFARNEFGFVDLTELYDEFHAYPLKKIEEKANSVILGRIIAMTVNEGSKSKGSEIYISLRESVLNPANWKVISPEGTTIQFKKKLGYQEERGDLRTRIYKIGNSAVKENMIFVGYVNETNDKGCFVKMGLNVSGRATHKELADSELQNPSAVFFKNRLVIGRVISVREDGKIDITLREQGVKYGYKLDDAKLKVGLLIKGIVSNHFKNSAVVALPGCRYSGVLRSEEVNTEGRSMEKAFPVGTSILTKIKHIEKSGNSMQLKLTCRIDENEINDKSNIFNAIEEEKSKENEKVVALYDSIQEVSKEYETLGDVSNINTGLVENLEAQNMEEELPEGEEEEEEEVEQGEEDEQNEAEESDDEEAGENVNNQRMMIEFGDEMEEEKEEVNEDEINEEQSVISEEEIGENMEFILSNKSTNKKKKEIQKMRFEAEVREREKKLLDEQGQELKTSDDYEKLLLKNPNSSYIWIQYVAFKFQKDGIEKARQLIERAIRTITFRNENEKLNLWTAYINLEFNFGTEDTLLKVFERAKGANSPKQVFMKLIDLYRTAERWDHVEELSKAMIKKHKNSSKAWISHLGDMLDVMKSKGVQNLDLSSIISRALQSLPKRKHLKLLPHHGILLFKNGAQEKGRTVFEAIVANYPKRTDIWSIYADMETKYGDKERFRNLMERCLTLDLNSKKMKFFFKRYLQYEVEHGTPERVEYVKQKAREYIENQMGATNNQDDEGDDEVVDE